MIKDNNITREFSAEEIIHIESENVRLKSEINKLKFVSSTIHSKNDILKLENDKLKNKVNDISYIDKLKSGFDEIYKVFRDENNELNEVIVGLKKEIEYYKELIKKNNK